MPVPYIPILPARQRFLRQCRAYPELFALVGGRVSDLRGQFLRGHGGNSAGLGAHQGHATRNYRCLLYLDGVWSRFTSKWSIRLEQLMGNFSTCRFMGRMVGSVTFCRKKQAKLGKTIFAICIILPLPPESPICYSISKRGKTFGGSGV